MLLSNDLFCKDNDSVVDELLTIFFAGSQTSANVTQNLLMHLNRHPEHEKRILEELDSVVVQPYREEHQGREASICDMYTFDRIQDMDWFSYCFNEAMRMQPPVPVSSLARMT